MSESTSIVPYLFMATFAMIIALGIWQYFKAKKAKREHHQSADARVHGDQPGPMGGTPDEAGKR